MTASCAAVITLYGILTEAMTRTTSVHPIAFLTPLPATRTVRPWPDGLHEPLKVPAHRGLERPT